MSWFVRLFGFVEKGPETVYANVEVDGEWIVSRANGRRFRHGDFGLPSLGELSGGVGAATDSGPPLSVREVVDDAAALHADPANAGALFQVASQFNALEMVNPGVTPESGITGYVYDCTQGPVCAMACAAGTLYRNYFVPVDGVPGQTVNRQIDCLADVASLLGSADHELWMMQNGYVLPTANGLDAIGRRLASMSPQQRRAASAALRVGVHRDTEVTQQDVGHSVTQVYASALPITYNNFPAVDWEGFARFVLEAAYKATIAAAVENRSRTGNGSVFLTLLGGGAFGNPEAWIADAIIDALLCYRYSGLDVAIVSYGTAQPLVASIINRHAEQTA